MKLFHLNKKYADSSSIPKDERRFYGPDDYYKFDPFEGTAFAGRKVIEYQERIKKTTPTSSGLYPPEIIAIYYCKSHPGKQRRYPAWYWFKYGVRDVGSLQRSLVERGYIERDQTKDDIWYLPTQKGLNEVEKNRHIIWAHQYSDDFEMGVMDAWIANEKFDGKDWQEQVPIFIHGLVENAKDAGEARNYYLALAKFNKMVKKYDSALEAIDRVIALDRESGEFNDYAERTAPGILEMKNKIIKERNENGSK